MKKGKRKDDSNHFLSFSTQPINELMIEKKQWTVQMSLSKKFQLYSCLAFFARCAGNAPLSRKLFETAHNLSKNFYDSLEPEEPFAIAIGFTMLAADSASTNNKKAERYVNTASFSF